MKNQVIIKHENIQKYNEEDPLIDLPKNTKQLRYQYFRPACSLKTILITAGISTIFILNSLFLKIFYQYRISRLKMLYNQETVGIPTIRTEFNFTMVQQSQKYQFQTFLAKNLKPFDSTNCLLQNIEGAILCKNFITKSKAFIDFVSSQQKDDIGCKLLQKYSIIYHFYGCKADYIGSCQQNIKKYHNWCLSESPQRIFWTNYKSLNETITESKLQNEHILVKMILHQTEWASFRSFPLKRMDFIDQIILQFNIQEAYLWGNLDILSSILQKFYPVRLHMSNQHCRPDYMIERRLRKLQSSVFSVTLVNKNLLQLTADTRSFKLYQLQEQVKISQKNCQMPQKGYLVAQPIQLEQISWNQQNLHQLSLQHVHSKLKYNYPTMGKLHQPAGFNFQKIPQNERIQYYNHIADLFKPFNDTSCQYARYGDENDQGYVVCKNFLSQSTALLNFGIQGKDAFGCQISSEFNTPNLQYDCTNSTKPFCRSNNEKNYFYYACVAERSQYLPILNRTFYSLKEILDRHKLVRKHITLKMDIQASQWVTFRSLPIEYLDYIDQIIIQIHLFENFGYFKGNYDILNILEENFYPVNFHQNNYNCWRVAFCKLRSSVFEVTLVNKRILKLHSFSRSYVTTTLNKPNRKNSEDCQIIDYL